MTTPAILTPAAHMVTATASSGGAGWDIVAELRQMLALHFMVNAFRAGTIVALIAGTVGWFMVLRRQSFAGHTLAVVSFPGAAGAIWLGVSATAGYFAGSIVAALVIAMVPRSSAGRERSEESAVIGTVQAFALACGVLFVSLYGGFLDSLTGLLFGTFLGISDRQVVILALVAAGVLAALAVMARPLFFATVDGDVAAAQQITVRPALSLALTVVLCLVTTWVSLGVAFYSVYPVGFYVSTIGFAFYVLAAGGRALASWLGTRPTRTGPHAGGADLADVAVGA